MVFDLFLIHAVCVVMPRAGSKKISDLGVWLVELFWSFWAYIWLYVILKVRDTITSQSRKNLSHGHVLHQKVGCMYASMSEQSSLRCAQVWTPRVITLWEASLTVLQYGLLLLHVYAQDKRWPFVSIPLYDPDS